MPVVSVGEEDGDVGEDPVAGGAEVEARAFVEDATAEARESAWLEFAFLDGSETDADATSVSSDFVLDRVLVCCSSHATSLVGDGEADAEAEGDGEAEADDCFFSCLWWCLW